MKLWLLSYELRLHTHVLGMKLDSLYLAPGFSCSHKKTRHLPATPAATPNPTLFTIKLHPRPKAKESSYANDPSVADHLKASFQLEREGLHGINSSHRDFYHLQLLSNRYRSTKVIHYYKPPLSRVGETRRGKEYTQLGIFGVDHN